MDDVTANHSYFFVITLEPISFLYLYHLTYVNKLRYQVKMAPEMTYTSD